MKVKFVPEENGVHLLFELVEGKNVQVLNVPLTKQQIEDCYRLEGFMKYVAWEELYELGIVESSFLAYESYYDVLKEEDGINILSTIGLPVHPDQLSGELSLTSLADEGDLSLRLKNSEGKNIDRIGKQYGGLYETGNELHLLPENVYKVKKAIQEDYETGYQKIGVSQQLAKEAGIQLENFLESENYHVVDRYDLDIKVHNHDHIELIPSGVNEQETLHLSSPSTVTSFKEGIKRNRYVKTQAVQDDMMKLSQKRHITGEDVPLFFENPSAILPEHDYQFDLETFSDRVRGLVQIERVAPYNTGGSGIQWFDSETGHHVPYNEDLLRGLMEKYPDHQYVEHEGKWIYLDPTLRKNLLDIPADEEAKLSKKFALDIKNNEQELDYFIEKKEELELQEIQVPQTLKADLFPHQLEGFQWLCHIEKKGIGGLLADDMGLGKTIQVISFLLHQQSRNMLKPTLIVLPIALIENWVEEIKKFSPALSNSIYIHRGSGRIKSAEVISGYDIVFTSYDTLKIDQLLLGKIKFKSIICDEAQNVKSHSSQRSRALRAMQSDFRLAMTGTPVENSLDELWSIMDFVQPGDLGSLRQFRERYAESGDYKGLLKAIQPFYMRRTKSEVLDKRLPKKFLKDPVFVEASNTQKSISNSMLETKETGQIAILNMLMRLRQLYGHPGVVIPKYEELEITEIPKFNKLLEIVEEIKDKDEKVLIFTEFRKLHSIFKRIFMQKYGMSVPVIDGDTKNRQAVVQAFNSSPGFGIILLSPKAAGVGLTITSANHVIHYTRWWNPAVENQATDRAYRIGQQKDVYVYQIITTDKDNFPQGTVEELMHQLLEDKRELAENVIVPFNTKEIQEMVLKKMVH